MERLKSVLFKVIIFQELDTLHSVTSPVAVAEAVLVVVTVVVDVAVVVF